MIAFEMAVEWRHQFKEDCIIDLICYRRYGHNELDQPMYTQPRLYSKVCLYIYIPLKYCVCGFLFYNFYIFVHHIPLSLIQL